MDREYHIQVTTQALEARVSPKALKVILQGNLRQDNLAGQFGHPEYHFDDNAFAAGWNYVTEQRKIILQSVAKRRDQIPAWLAFGRLSHALQDFYAHSNYLQLWEERFPGGKLPPPESLAVGDPALLRDPRLRSGRIYLPLDALAFIPGFKSLARRWLPPDSHAHMNLDSPDRGHLFPYALVAARRQTRQAFDEICGQIQKTMGASAVRFFTDFLK